MREILGMKASAGTADVVNELFDKYLSMPQWMKKKLPVLEPDKLTYRDVLEEQLDQFSSFLSSVEIVWSRICRRQPRLPDYRSESKIIFDLETALLKKFGGLPEEKKTKVDAETKATIMLIMIGRRLRAEKESCL